MIKENKSKNAAIAASQNQTGATLAPEEAAAIQQNVEQDKSKFEAPSLPAQSGTESDDPLTDYSDFDVHALADHYGIQLKAPSDSYKNVASNTFKSHVAGLPDFNMPSEQNNGVSSPAPALKPQQQDPIVSTALNNEMVPKGPDVMPIPSSILDPRPNSGNTSGFQDRLDKITKVRPQIEDNYQNSQEIANAGEAMAYGGQGAGAEISMAQAQVEAAKMKKAQEYRPVNPLEKLGSGISDSLKQLYNIEDY